MRICLFEDARVTDFEPLSLTRPVFDLRCGCGSLADKQRRFAGDLPWSVLIRPHLEAIYRLDNPSIAVNDLDHLASEPVVLINGRWLPPAGMRLDSLSTPLGLVEGELAYIVLAAGQLRGIRVDDLPECLEKWQRHLTGHEVGGRLLEYLWDLVEHNGQEICHDWQALGHPELPALSSPPTNQPTVVGPPGQFVCHPSARIDPMVVIDTRNGPVFIERDVVVTPFTRIEGPAVIGLGSQLLGANVRAGTTLGPYCRVGGEVEASILQGYSNKYHDGFLGHAYLGEWVNLGAGTHNSDLRNDYGEVQVRVNGRLVRTGHNKVGCFLGDHTKSAIGSLLNTGSNVGIFASLLPGGLLPRWVPSFCTGQRQQLLDRVDLDALLGTASEVMRRRGVVFGPAHTHLYRYLFRQTARERQLSMREQQKPRFRQSA
jgi:UDP-N-acetylglucosamine diphosphorylase/glucosamine-1-phosphate N-acetyltransferase